MGIQYRHISKEECDVDDGVSPNNTLNTWTTSQLDIYCSEVQSWLSTCNIFDQTISYSFAIFGILGVIGYVFMFLALFHYHMSPASRMYHQALAACGIIYAPLMIQYGILRIFHFPGIPGMDVWSDGFESGRTLGSCVQLTASCLNIVVSIERCIAIWCRQIFPRFDRIRIALPSIILSFLIGLTQLVPTVYYYIDYYSDIKYDLDSIGTEFKTIMIWVNFGLICAMSIFSIFIIVGLIKHASQVESLDLEERREWTWHKRLCYLQLILTALALTDFFIDYAYDLMLAESTNLIVYDDGVVYLKATKIEHCLEFANELMEVIINGGRFYFFLLLERSFFDAFVKVLKKGNSNGSTETPVIELVSRDQGNATKPLFEKRIRQELAQHVRV